MATSICSNCNKETVLIPPHYICKNCNLPIQKKANNPLDEIGFNIPYPKILKKEAVTNQAIKAWLIVHTENKEPKHYELKEGDNFFGRETDKNKLDIPIKGDKYVSRYHARIAMFKDMDFEYCFEIMDDGKERNGKPSTNGTYINGNKERLSLSEAIKIKDGDTIQIGVTKLVFKSTKKVKTVDEAVTQVVLSDYTKTILVQ